MPKQRTEQPIQLRIGFTAPTRPLTLHLALSGLSVLAEAVNGTYDEVFHYLSSAGIVATNDAVRGISFPATMLPLLVHLPEQVNVAPEEALRPLYLLAVHPSDDNLPATLSLDHYNDLHLSWFDGSQNWDEQFSANAAPALLNSELPFVATTEAWGVLKSACRLPVLAGRAKVNLDGYVEIFTTKPQLAEGAPLPGMFRLDETHFGLPLPYASFIDQSPGFVWEGHKPVLERGPSKMPDLPVELSHHALSDLSSLVDHLAAYRAQAVVWDSGLGKRIFALAAVEVLDAWPLLIVTSPASVWVWRRHLDLFNRSHSLTHDRTDAQILTYLDLAQRTNLSSPQAIIFDDMSSSDASSPLAQSALHRLDGVLDAYRIVTGSSWPEQLEAQVGVMSVLRPGEFRSDIPLGQRYPVHTAQRVKEHVNAYLSKRNTSDPNSASTEHFRRSSVISVKASEAQLLAFSDAIDRQGRTNPTGVLAELLEIISAGPTHAISPKVAAAARAAKEATAKNRRVAILTRHRRSALLLKAALRPLPVVAFEASEKEMEDTQVAIIRFDHDIPNLRSFDEVICMDYPWSMETLERSIGPAASERGPLKVTCIHMVNTVDDRLAMLCARRSELSLDPFSEDLPSPQEITYLLSPRWRAGTV